VRRCVLAASLFDDSVATLFAMAVSIRRLGGFALAALCFNALASCSASRRAAPAPPAPAPFARLSLDAEASPLPFRWLADDAVLVAPTLGERKLAGFGNYVARAALKQEQARLSVWDDEQAWKLASSGRGNGDEVLAHRRAEYLKDGTLSEPVDRFLVFSRDGEVIYQRDFRSWPLTELD
jgi:hypothetical protein